MLSFEYLHGKSIRQFMQSDLHICSQMVFAIFILVDINSINNKILLICIAKYKIGVIFPA